MINKDVLDKFESLSSELESAIASIAQAINLKDDQGALEAAERANELVKQLNNTE